MAASEKIENRWIPLENCKSGEVLISATFKKSVKKVNGTITKIPVDEDSFTEEKVENIKTESSQESSSTRTSVVHNSINFAVKSEKDMVNYEKGDDMSTSIDFVDPVYVDNEYIILAGSNYNWFMVRLSKFKLSLLYFV